MYLSIYNKQDHINSTFTSHFEKKIVCIERTKKSLKRILKEIYSMNQHNINSNININLVFSKKKLYIYYLYIHYNYYKAFYYIYFFKKTNKLKTKLEI